MIGPGFRSTHPPAATGHRVCQRLTRQLPLGFRQQQGWTAPPMLRVRGISAGTGAPCRAVDELPGHRERPSVLGLPGSRAGECEQRVLSTVHEAYTVKRTYRVVRWEYGQWTGVAPRRVLDVRTGPGRGPDPGRCACADDRVPRHHPHPHVGHGRKGRYSRQQQKQAGLSPRWRPSRLRETRLAAA
jgi:hypothetical protein